MFRVRLIAAVSAAALAVGMLGAPVAFAATKKPATKVVTAKVVKKKVVVVTGKVKKIDVVLAMVTLSNGKTYKLVNPKDLAKYKVGHTVHLHIG